MDKITEKTWVPISIVVTMVVTAVSVAFWIAALSFDVKANAAQYQDMKASQKETNEKMENKMERIFQEITELKLEIKRSNAWHSRN